MNKSGWVRKPAIAGLFYPADPHVLQSDILTMLETSRRAVREDLPRALVAPHAGYPYSGPVAASAYSQLEPHAGRIRRVVLLGPSHHVAFHGMATTSAVAYRTPLGNIDIDTDSMRSLESISGILRMDEAHLPEHSLEVQLPFLQVVLSSFTIVPLVVGNTDPAFIAEILETLLDGMETLLVVSTDLSHFHGYQAASTMDRHTCQAVERLDARAITLQDACGHIPLAGLLLWARDHALTARTLDLRNSGDTAGSRDSVVGYGAWAFY